MEKVSRKLLVSLIFLGFVLPSTQALAYFKLAKKDVASHGTEANSSLFEDTSVTQVGTAPVMEKITSKGNDLPLKIALEMVLPSTDWTMESTVIDRSFLNQKINWDHDGTWIDSLEKIGGDHGLNFLVNWTTRTLYVSKTKFKRAPSRPSTLSEKMEKQPSSVSEKLDQIQSKLNQEAVMDNKAFKKDDSDGPVKNSVVPVVATKENLWALEKGSLKKQLEGWSQKGGYQLNWQASYDWMISTNAEFTGSFEQAVETLIRGLYNQSAGVIAELYTGNKVLVIKGE